MHYYILNFCLCLAQMLVLFINLTPKYNKYISFIVPFVPFTAVALSQRALSFVNPVFLVIVAHAIFFITVFTAFKDSVKIKLFVSLSELGVLYIGTLITMPIAYTMGTIEEPDSATEIADIIISVLLLTAFTVFFKMKKDDFALAKFSAVEFSVVILAQLICILGCMLILNEDKAFAPEKILVIFGKDSTVAVGFLTVSGVMFLVSDFALLMLMLKEAKSARLKEQLLIAEYKNEISLEHYKTIENRIEETRKIRHDLANIVQVAYKMVSSGNTDDSENILNILSDSIKNIHIEKYAENTLINTILSIKAKACREQGIIYDFQISLPESIRIDDIDICKAFVNLIDNAISAAEKCEKKYIEVRSHIENEEVYIAVLNSCIPTQSKSSEKKDRNHGFGQKILSEIAEAYDGKFVAEQNGNEYRAVLALKQKQA